MEERPIGNHKIQQSDKIIEMKTFAFISDATFMCLLNCFALFHQFEFLIGRFIGLMYSTVLQLRSTFLLPGPPHVARTYIAACVVLLHLDYYLFFSILVEHALSDGNCKKGRKKQ